MPQGYGHDIENTRSKDTEVVLNNATYQSMMAANAGLLLSTNFKVQESVFAKFPKHALIMLD